MWSWTVGVDGLAIIGLIAYAFYLRFLRHIFDKGGIEDALKIAKRVRVPRPIESIVSVATAFSRAGDHDKPDDVHIPTRDN